MKVPDLRAQMNAQWTNRVPDAVLYHTVTFAFAFAQCKLTLTLNSPLICFSGDSCEEEDEAEKAREPSKYSYVTQFPVDIARLEAAHAQATKATPQRPHRPPPQVCTSINLHHRDQTDLHHRFVLV